MTVAAVFLTLYMKLKNLSNYDLISNAHGDRNIISVPMSQKATQSSKVPNIAEYFRKKTYDDIEPPSTNIPL